jgi:Na+/H+-dicarboxylate symporter
MSTAIPAPQLSLQKFVGITTTPWAVLGCLIFGGFLGTLFPEFSKPLSVVGSVYVDLLTMIVMPFLVSSVIFSLQKLFREGGAGKVLGRLVTVFLVATFATALLSTVAANVVSPGSYMSDLDRETLGKIVGKVSDGNNTVMALRTLEEPKKDVTLKDVMDSLIPSNIFASLANGETLKALIFALLFGMAAGQVPTRISDGLNQTLETIYGACQTLTKWINIPLPIVLICLSASQIATTGLESILAMGNFVLSFSAIVTVFLLICLLVLRFRSEMPMGKVISSLKTAFALAVATNNTATCMPAMIDGMTNGLNFTRSRVELLVPLAASLMRAGAVTYFVCATLFIADMYGRSITMNELGMLVALAAMAGFATAGMTGVVTVGLVGTLCTYLGLPFEAAFILFVAVDPICTIFRTSLNVIGSCAAISVICPTPLKL